MNYGFTGTRPPKIHGFTRGEVELIESQVADLPRGTRIGQGGCIGVDEIIGRVAFKRSMYVVTFLPGPAWRDYTSLDVLGWSNEVVDTHKSQMDRNHDIVLWADVMRAVPLYEGEQDINRRGRFYSRRQPRSGTWACVRLAQEARNLRRIVVLRDARQAGDAAVYDIVEGLPVLRQLVLRDA